MNTTGAYDLYIAECNAMHALLDDLGAPRELRDEKLTPSQRLGILKTDILGLGQHIKQLHVLALTRATGRA